MKKLVHLLVSFLGAFMLPALALAQEAAAEHTASGGANSGVALAVGLCMGVAALGGTLSQGKAAASALEGIGRNPGAAGKIQTNMIISLAMIESLVLFALLISFLLMGKI